MQAQRVRMGVVVCGTALTGVAWAVALPFTSRELGPSGVLVLAQMLLAAAALCLVAGGGRSARAWDGHGVVPILGLHVFLHYTASNTVPALLPQLRDRLYTGVAWRFL